MLQQKTVRMETIRVIDKYIPEGIYVARETFFSSCMDAWGLQ